MTLIVLQINYFLDNNLQMGQIYLDRKNFLS